VRLADPDRRNALTLESARALARTLETVAADEGVRAVLLDAEGPAFCVGADLRKAAGDPAAFLPRLAQEYHRATFAVLTMAKPVVCAVQGVAAGGGLALVLACDYRIGAEVARFRFAYPSIGVGPDGGASWTLPRTIGRARYQRMVLEDPVLTAREAQEWGILHEVVAADVLEGAAGERARRLAEGPTAAFAELKRLSNPPEEVGRVLMRELEAMRRTAATEDCRTAIAAFLEKRALEFRGR
jgi:2-(1,2-epoxy-1,2-dihydrophenyl)acetyl-CoA isomerase